MNDYEKMIKRYAQDARRDRDERDSKLKELMREIRARAREENQPQEDWKSHRDM